MTRGLGLSIGTVNAMSAVTVEDPAKPTVRTRRTALTFDEAGRPRIGAINEFASAITDFADLSRDPEPLVVNGRFYSATNLIAAVVTGLIELAEPAAGVVLTYPAVYSDKQVALLGQALHLAGAGQVLLAPEPVAAAEWLEVDQGPLAPGFVLVYDLGANSLDLTVLRVGPDWPHHPMVGTPVRSTDFGGKPLGEMVARYAGSPSSGRATQTLTSMVNTDALRAEHIRDTFPLVSKTVAAAGLRLADLSRILLVGGATRPPEVARTLAELGVPLVTVADPGQVVAAGASALAARTFAPVQQGGPSAPHVAVFSSAAVVSALAMSAMTVFGSPFDPGLTPVLERFPALGAPAEAMLYDMSADLVAARNSGVLGGVDPVTGRVGAAGVAIAQSAYEMIVAPKTPARDKTEAAGGERGTSPKDLRDDCRPPARSTYGDPARFINPLPFPGSLGQPQNTPTKPGPISTPGTPTDPTAPGTGTPGTGTPGTDTPGTGTPGTDQSAPAPGAGTSTDTAGTPGGTGTGTAPSGETGGTPTTGGTTDGASTGGTTEGGSAGGTTGGGTTGGAPTDGGGTTGGTSGTGAGGTSTGGSTGGGTTGGGTSTGGSDGGTSTGGGTSGGGASSGGASGGGDSGGGASGGGASGGGDSGGSTGGGASGGGASGGGASGGGDSSGGASGGGASGGGASSGGASGGGASGGGASGGASSGGTSGGASSGGASGGTSGGASSSASSGGASSGGASSGGTSSGGSMSGGGSKSGGASGGAGGGGGGGGGGGSRR
ncbi:Hsp70 family protein [Nocardia asteroides]|uniref:Hsp70 family protein n=1 Tax=Nocardia asteroides TaxID=1824 RepID=UPI00364DB5B1